MTGTSGATITHAPRVARASFEALQDAAFASASPATLRAFPVEQRLRGEDLLEFLRYKRNAIISTTRVDLRPHATVATYLVYDACFWLPTVAGAVRTRNAHALPYASLTIAEGEGEGHVTVLVEGTVHAVRHPEVGVLATYEARFGAIPDWADTWLVVEPERILSYTDRP